MGALCKRERPASVLAGIVRDEMRNLEKRERALRKEIKALPAGSLFIRDGRYAYLKRRENGKVGQKYLGAAESPKVSELREKIERRRNAEGRLRRIASEIRIARKMLNAAAR